MRKIIGFLLVFCLVLTGCAGSGQEEESAQVGYKPPEVVGSTVQTGDKDEIIKEEEEAQKVTVPTGTGEQVEVVDYTGKFPVITEKNTFSTFNINMKNENGKDDQSYATRLKLLMELLVKYNPDVITFQEVGSDWMDFIVPQLENIYDYYLIYPQKEDKTTANPIFFKIEKFEDESGGCFWVSDTPEEESPAPDGKYYNCTWLQLKEKASGNSVYIFNSKLSPEVGQKGAEIIRSKCEFVGWKKAIVCNLDLGAALDSAAGTVLQKNLFNSNTTNNATPTSYVYSGAGDIHDFSLYTKVCLSPKTYKVVTDRIDGKMVSDHNPIFSEFSINTETLNYEDQFIF
ncbi:MAG: endonuclease/exonuclease/phosphatase family protein [Clostridia bacterium]|nr:endonuclease/exonuclease/phosphatase family protein [Clostridia bacterium]